MLIIVLFLCIIGFTGAYPSSGPVPLTPEQVKRLEAWTPDDKQNIWELSGQFEGDIILDKSSSRNGILNEKYRWPNKELPYELDSVFTANEKKLIQDSLELYNKQTCIKVRPRNSTDTDYVYVKADNSGCWSYVGRIGNRQNLNLQNPGCLSTGIIQHEFLHALGFHHQHSASDRDDYVTILWDNIKEGAEGNFEKKSSSQVTDFGVAYDYGSVMHYSAYAFSANNQKTIQTTDPSAEIGQNKGLSAKDITKLKKMYNCN